MKIHVRVLFVLLLSAALSACGTKMPAQAGAVPNPLQIIESKAEDIIDYAPSGGWDKINADVSEISKAWKEYQPQASQDGISQEVQDSFASALTRLEAASTQQDAPATMQASNDLSAAVVEMFAAYEPKIPADIGRLDVLERQVILDVAANDYALAARTLASVRTVWEQVKTSVLEHNGQDVITEFEASLSTQEAAIAAQDAAALIKEARNGLELVDALEELY